MLDPGDCGGEPLLAAAVGAGRPSSSRQQSQKEEVLRSRRAPRSAAISAPRAAAAAAAAAAPRSPRLLPSRAPQPVPRCRLGSRGRRRHCSARPGPRGPSRGRGDSGAPPSSPDTSGCGDWGREALEVRACPGGRSGIAPLLSLGPGPLYRASEETEWPPGGNLGAQRVGAGIYVLAKNNSDPARLLLGPGAAPVGGGPPRSR